MLLERFEGHVCTVSGDSFLAEFSDRAGELYEADIWVSAVEPGHRSRIVEGAEFTWSIYATDDGEGRGEIVFAEPPAPLTEAEREAAMERAKEMVARIKAAEERAAAEAGRD
jgi:hypothetical protein